MTPDRQTTMAATRRPRAQRAASVCLVAWAALGLVGCAAFTNPVANGVPVRLLPDDVLGESRENYQPIDLTLLRAGPPDRFLLDTGDTLGIYIEGVIGDQSVAPPVNLPAAADQPPSIGYPFPIRSDGTISLPLAGSVTVAGKTIEEAEEAVINAYLDKQIIRPEDFRIIVTLLRARTVRVQVIRQDGGAPGITIQNQGLRGLGSTSTTIGGGSNATGNALELPVYENDLLNALTASGGLPAENTADEVLIYRGYATEAALGECFSCPLPQGGLPDPIAGDGRRIIRVPLRKKCGTLVSIPRDDIVLQDGDIIYVPPLEPERYYTGGLLPSGEQFLPLDYDLTVVEAVLRSQGPLVNGGINSSNLQGNIVGAGVGNPSPSNLTVLRQLPCGQQLNILVDLNEALLDPRENILVQADDVLLLQENRDEALTRYFFNSVFRMDFFFRIINRNDAQGSATFLVP